MRVERRYYHPSYPPLHFLLCSHVCDNHHSAPQRPLHHTMHLLNAPILSLCFHARTLTHPTLCLLSGRHAGNVGPVHKPQPGRVGQVASSTATFPATSTATSNVNTM